MFLTIDLASNSPSFLLIAKGQEHYIDLSNIQDSSGRQDIAMYPNALFTKLNELDLDLQGIESIGYCSGPGPFSALRCACILIRLMHRFQDGKIKIYRFNQLDLYYADLLEQGELFNSSNFGLYLRSGLKGFFYQQYQNNQKSQEIQLINAPEFMPKANDIEINESKLSRPMSEVIYQLIQKKRYGKENIIHSLEDIQPLYIREPGISRPKKKA